MLFFLIDFENYIKHFSVKTICIPLKQIFICNFKVLKEKVEFNEIENENNGV